jgi:hypothetical protein
MRISLIEFLCGLGVVFLVVALFCGGLAQPYFEAQTYNKLTGSNVSTWDAMWVELRVEGKVNQ